MEFRIGDDMGCNFENMGSDVEFIWVIFDGILFIGIERMLFVNVGLWDLIMVVVYCFVVMYNNLRI